MNAKHKFKWSQTWGPEPWEVREVTGGGLSRKVKDLCIFDAENRLITVIETVRIQENFSDLALANATRIAACVTGCKQ